MWQERDRERDRNMFIKEVVEMFPVLGKQNTTNKQKTRIKIQETREVE